LDYGFCAKCQDDHAVRGDLPLCMREQKCEQFQGAKPVFLYGLNVFAWRIAFDAMAFSQSGEHGLPSLSSLEFALKNSGYIFSEHELSDILRKVQMIYSSVKSILIAEINANIESNK